MKKLLFITLLFLYPLISMGQETTYFCEIEIYKYNHLTKSYYFDKATTSTGYMYTNDDEIKIYVDGEVYYHFLKSNLELIENKTEDGVQAIILRHKKDTDVFIQATKRFVAVGKNKDYKVILNTCK